MTLNIILTVVLIAALLYTAVFFYQRRSASKAATLKEKKDQLASIPVRDELLEGRKLALSGQTLKQYQQLESDYNDLENNKFIKIDNQVNVVTFESRGINVIKTRNETIRLQDMVKESEESINNVRDGIKKLITIDEEHKQAVAALTEKYETLYQRINENAETLGPTVPALNQKYEKLRKNYDEFAELTEQGDHVKATDVYEQLKIETNDIEKEMDEIPEIYNKLNIKYPEQLEELENGSKELIKQGFYFETSPKKMIDDIESQRLETLNMMGSLQLKETKDQLGFLERRIEEQYQTMENEISSKETVKVAGANLSTQIEKVRKQNQALVIELDRLTQKFELSHGEIEETRKFTDDIKNYEESSKKTAKDMRAKVISYSAVSQLQNENLASINRIEERQKELWSQITTYDSSLSAAQKEWQEMSQDLIDLRKSIERRNLPGLPSDYRIAYQNAGQKISQLGEYLSETRVNLDEVVRQLNVAKSDLDSLHEQSNNVINEAEVTEDLIRYSNRYRQDPRMNAAIEQAKLVYEREFNFAQAEQIVGQTLNQIENGAWEAIRDQQRRRSRNVL